MDKKNVKHFLHVDKKKALTTYFCTIKIFRYCSIVHIQWHCKISTIAVTSLKKKKIYCKLKWHKLTKTYCKIKFLINMILFTLNINFTYFFM